MGFDDATPPYGTDISDEPITEPDLPSFPCPYCCGYDGQSTGFALDTTQWGVPKGDEPEAPLVYRAVARRCRHCEGRKIINRQQMAEYHAMRNGRPR